MEINPSEMSSDRMLCTMPEIIRLSYGMEQANSYLLISGNHTVIVDVPSKCISDELIKRRLKPDYILLTHEHVDHLWGLNLLRERFQDVKVIAQEQCSKAIVSPLKNEAAQYHIYAVLRFGEEYKNAEAENRKYYCAPADIVFDDMYELPWRGYSFRLIHTPGHSPGSSLIFINDKVFSGDTMLNEDTFLNFSGGDKMKFFMITIPIISTIDSDMKIFPGHGKPFLKKEWNEGVLDGQSVKR